MQDVTIALPTNMEILRRNRRITQVELAEMLNVSQPMISHFETGKQTPTELQLQKIADAIMYPGNPQDLLLTYGNTGK